MFNSARHLCPTCGMTYRSSRDLDNHIDRCHGDRPSTHSHPHSHNSSSQAPPSYSPGYKTQYKSSTPLHHTSGNHPCPYPNCHETFRYSESLDSHIERTHVVEEFKDRTGQWKFKLEQDRYEDSLWPCGFCDRKLASGPALRSHLNSQHPEDGIVHKCSWCGETFGIGERGRDRLRRHLYERHRENGGGSSSSGRGNGSGSGSGYYY